jgi:hypothetical protein
MDEEHSEPTGIEEEQAEELCQGGPEGSETM